MDNNNGDNVDSVPLKKKSVKGSRIKNQYYVEFLETGMIQYINPEHIDKAVAQIQKNRDMAMSLIFCLYLTGARPIEILNLKAKDVSKDGSHYKIQVAGAKNGLPRPIFLKSSNKYARHVYEYSRQLLPDMWLHHSFRGKYVRSVINKKGVVKTYAELSRPVRSNFAKWFKNVLGEQPIVPYHLRHNRFSKLSEAGASLEDMRITKGAKTLQSITPYIHMSAERGKKMAKNID